MLDSSGEIVIPAGEKILQATWTLPEDAQGIIVFVHGSGSSRLSPRNQQVAKVLQQARFATLLMDLLDETEAEDRTIVFDIDLLADRVVAVLDWLTQEEPVRDLPIGLFGASTGAAAALQAAARRPGVVTAVVSRGGRPDLAWQDLPAVAAPTLLIVGGRDHEVLQLNRNAALHLHAIYHLQVVPNATHLFGEPGTLQKVAALAKQWFLKYLSRQQNDGAAPSGGFIDRADAARRLAARLRKRSFTDPLILAIPRGGVVLGAILAEELQADLDVILARKLRMPGNPECALGALSEMGEVYLNIPENEITPRWQTLLEQERQLQLEEIARRRDLYRHGRPSADVAGRSVIVADDGIATGATMIAALRSLQGEKPLEVLVAVPVAAPDRLREVRKACPDTVCLIEAPHLLAVGQFYQDFRQIEDDEVCTLLERFAHAQPGVY